MSNQRKKENKPIGESVSQGMSERMLCHKIQTMMEEILSDTAAHSIFALNIWTPQRQTRRFPGILPFHDTTYVKAVAVAKLTASRAADVNFMVNDDSTKMNEIDRK